MQCELAGTLAPVFVVTWLARLLSPTRGVMVRKLRVSARKGVSGVWVQTPSGGKSARRVKEAKMRRITADARKDRILLIISRDSNGRLTIAKQLVLV